MSGFRVGAFNSSTVNGDVAEVIMYNNVLSDSERKTVENYLINKYNTQVLTSPLWEGGPYTLNGTSVFVQSTYNIGITGNQPWSVKAIVSPQYAPQFGGGYGRSILGWGNAAQNQAVFLYHNSDTDKFEWGHYANDTATSASYPENATYTIAVTYDGTTEITYVNGAKGSRRTIGVLNLADSKLVVGIDPFGQGRYFKGTISNVKVYNRALSSNERN